MRVDTTPMPATVYGVEAAVWACLTGAWLALRLQFSRSPLEEFALVPAAGLSVCALLATSASDKPRPVELATFHVTFGAWVALVYCVVEALLTPAFAAVVLENLSFALASAAISLSFLTILTLMVAAGVSEGSVWAETTWAAAALVFVTTVHACTKHDTQLSLSFAVVILWADFAAACLQPFQLHGFPLELGIGPLSAQQILDIASLSVQTVSAGFALASALLAGRTGWALPAFLAVPLAVQLYSLLSKDEFRPVPPAEEAEVFEAGTPEFTPPAPSAPQMPVPQFGRAPAILPQPARQAPAILPQPARQAPAILPQPARQAPATLPQPARQAPATLPQFRQHHYHFQQAATAEQPAAPAEQPSAPPQHLLPSRQHHYHFAMTHAQAGSGPSKLVQDALLFGRARPIVPKVKKNS